MQNADMQRMLESVAELPPIDTEIIYGSCLRHEVSQLLCCKELGRRVQNFEDSNNIEILYQHNKLI